MTRRMRRTSSRRRKYKSVKGAKIKRASVGLILALLGYIDRKQLFRE